MSRTEYMASIHPVAKRSSTWNSSQAWNLEFVGSVYYKLAHACSIASITTCLIIYAVTALSDLQVILGIAFTKVNSITTAINILHNSQLWNASIAGPLKDITTINISHNTRLEALEINMPPNSSLETLILSNNNLTTVSPEWFINTPNLTQISLANNSICKYAQFNISLL